MSKFIGAYRRFRHNILYKDGFFKWCIVGLLTLLAIDLIALYFVW